MSAITAVIITRNESLNIGRCIMSLRHVADEILVSDSNSTDDTVAIARELGARVIVRDFAGYGATKNFANNEAAHDWIFSIDADEELDPELAESILNVKTELNHQTVYECQRLNNYCGKWINHGGWYPDKKIRLFNRKFVHWDLAEVHESLIIPLSFTTQLLKGKLLHYSYTSIESHLNKIERYSSRGAEEAFKKGKHASWIKLFLSPAFRFVRDYLFKLGLLDGYYGFVIAKLTAREVHLKYKKLKRLTAGRQ